MIHGDCSGTDCEYAEWHAIWEAMDYQPTADELVGAEAATDQIEAAAREAAQYDCRHTSKYAALKFVPDVREQLLGVMTMHRVRIPEADFGKLQTFTEILSGPGMPLRFDRNDSRQWSGGLFGLVAGKENNVHVLRGKYTVERWLADVQDRRHDCQWESPGCAEYCNRMLTFSFGAYVVAVATCFACERYLLAGGSRNAPVTHLGV